MPPHVSESRAFSPMTTNSLLWGAGISAELDYTGLMSLETVQELCKVCAFLPFASASRTNLPSGVALAGHFCFPRHMGTLLLWTREFSVVYQDTHVFTSSRIYSSTRARARTLL